VQSITRRAALALMGMGLGITAAQAKGKAPVARDLTTSETPGVASNQITPRAGRRAMHVSVMPIGPSTIAIGAPLGFRMVSTTDSFGSLYVLSASGRTQVWFENIRLRAGNPIVFPPRNLIVRAAPPAGDETVIFIASRERPEGIEGAGVATPMDLPFSHSGLRAAIQQKYAGVPRERWAFSEIQIRVHD
jgi:hypothetical protein